MTLPAQATDSQQLQKDEDEKEKEENQLAETA